MSVVIGYYFNSVQPLPQLAEKTSDLLGCSLVPYEGDRTDFFCRFLAMEFSLSRNVLENDRDLNFEDFDYSLDVRIPSPDNDLRPVAVQTMMSIAYVLQTRMKINKGILVWDAQSILARYELSQDEQNNDVWYDSVSGRSFDDPEHWLSIASR